MPLSVNIGLSRKMSRDYQSIGISVNLNAELDATLLTKPGELQGQIENLYAQAEQALDRQATKLEPTGVPQRAEIDRDRDTNRGNGRNGGTNQGRGNGSGGGMTASQRRAVEAIARRLNVDPRQESRDIIGTELDQLSIREASELIDHLRGLQSAGNVRNGGGR